MGNFGTTFQQCDLALVTVSMVTITKSHFMNMHNMMKTTTTTTTTTTTAPPRPPTNQTVLTCQHLAFARPRGEPLSTTVSSSTRYRTRACRRTTSPSQGPP